MYDEYVDRQGEVVTGIVQQAGDRNNVLVDLGRVEALLPQSEQVDGERYEQEPDQGGRCRVRSGTKGPQVILRAATPSSSVRCQLEVPEIADGLVEIRGVAREPGYRSEDRGRVAHAGSRPGRRLCRPRGSRATAGRLGLRGGEDRHHPVEHGARPLRREALSRPGCARSTSTTRRARRPSSSTTSSRSRSQRGERPPRDPPDGLEDRHRVRDRVRAAEAQAAFAGNADDEDYSGRCAAILSNGKRCPERDTPGRAAASPHTGARRHRAGSAARGRGGGGAAETIEEVAAVAAETSGTGRGPRTTPQLRPRRRAEASTLER